MSKTKQSAEYLGSVDVTCLCFPYFQVTTTKFSYGFWFNYDRDPPSTNAMLTRLSATSDPTLADYNTGGYKARFVDLKFIRYSYLVFKVITNDNNGSSIDYTSSLEPFPAGTTYKWLHFSIGIDIGSGKISLIYYDPSADLTYTYTKSGISFSYNFTFGSETTIFFGLKSVSSTLSYACSGYTDFFVISNYLIDETGAFYARMKFTSTKSFTTFSLFDKTVSGTTNKIADYSGRNNYLEGNINLNIGMGTALGGTDMLNVSLIPISTDDVKKLTVAFWIYPISYPLSGENAQVFRIVDLVTGTTNRMVMICYDTACQIYFRLQWITFDINLLVLNQWNSVIIATNDKEYFTFSSVKGWASVYINKAKIYDSLLTYSTSPTYTTFNFILGSSVGYQAFNAYYAYLTVSFGYEFSTDFYYTCYDLCDISLGITCMSCYNTTMLYWLDSGSCQAVLSPPISQCPNYFALSGKCTCISGYRFATYVFGCEPCLDSNCLKCDGSASVCEQCSSLYFVNNGVCERYCHPACTACTERTPYRCSECSQGYLLDGTTCGTTCNTTSYPDTIQRKCIKCSYPCLSCTSSTFCTSCTNNTFLEPGNTGQCVTSCPTGYYGDQSSGTCTRCNSACSKCIDGSNANCSTCATGSFRLLPKHCFTSCPIGYYGDKNTKICFECHSSCMTCSGALSSNCLTCASNGYYVSSGTCKPCDSSCKECTGGGIFDCLSCNPGAVLKDGVCVSTDCPSGTFPIASTGECFPCPSSCKTCTTITSCTSCIDSKALYYTQCIDCSIAGYVLKDNVCTEICGDGFNFGQKECDDGNSASFDGCSADCKVEAGWRCSGGSAKGADTCTLISNIRYLISGNDPKTEPFIYFIFDTNVTVNDDWLNIIAIKSVLTGAYFTNFTVDYNGTFGVYYVDMTYYKYTNFQESFVIEPLGSSYILDLNGNVIAIQVKTITVDFTYLTFTKFIWQDIVVPIFRVIMLVPIVLHMIVGKQHVSWISLEALQNVALYCFFNVQYDTFLLTVFDITYAMVMQWFPNPFKSIEYDNYIAGRKPPVKFQMYQFSSLFLQNSGGYLIIVGLSVLLSYILKKLEKKKKTSLYASLSRALSSNQLKRLGLSLFSLITIGIMIQVSHSNFTSSVEYASFVTSILSGIAIIGTYLFIYLQGLMEKSDKMIKKKKKNLSNDHTIDGFFEHFKTREKGISFSLFQLVSKLVMAGTITYVSKYPIGQMFLAAIARVISVVAAWNVLPFERKRDTVYFFILEGLSFWILILLMLEQINYEGYGIQFTYTGTAGAFVILMVVMISAYTIYMIFKDRAMVGYVINQKINMAQVREGRLTRKLKKLHIENLAD